MTPPTVRIGFSGIVLLVFLVSCQSRSRLAGHNALLGHWEVEGGNVEYYFTKDHLVRVLRKDVISDPIKYKVIRNSHSTDLVIRLEPDKDLLEIQHDKFLAFEKDRNKIMVKTKRSFNFDSLVFSSESLKTLNGERLEIWWYKDTRQQP